MFSARRCSFVFVLVLLLSAHLYSQVVLSNWKDPHITQKNGYIYSDVWAFRLGNRTYAMTGHYQALPQGVHFIDITNPLYPNEVLFWTPPSANGDFRSVVEHKGFAYLASNGLGGGGTYILDLRKGVANATLVAQIRGGNGGQENVHNHWVETQGLDDFLYTVSVRDQYIYVFKVTDPAHPVKVARINVGVATDKAHECVVRNNRLYVSYIGTQKTGIFDVSQIGLGKWTKLCVWYTDTGHCAFPSPDCKLLVTTKERFGGTARIWDISKVPASKPTLITEFRSDVVRNINWFDYSRPVPWIFYDFVAYCPHHAYFTDNRTLWISWYQGGIAKIDLSIPSAPRIVGRFDTYAGSDPGMTMDGCWGIYPWFGDNLIVASDINSGIFVVDFTR